MTEKTNIPGIAISIVTWNSATEIGACLRSLENLPENWEIWVVDNASSDRTAEMVASEFPRVKLIANQDNVGFAKANNQVIEQTSTDYVLLLNPDTEASAEDLQKSLEIVQSDSRIGILGVRLQHEDGSLQENCFHFPTLGLNIINNLGLYRFFSPRWKSERILNEFFAHDRARPVDWVMGAFMFVRREAIEKAGGVPEDYFMFAEDMDWCYRVRQSGFEVWFSPLVSVTHKLNRSAGQLPSIWRVQKTVFSKYLFCYRHFGWLKTRLIQLTDLIGFSVGIWWVKFRKTDPQTGDGWKMYQKVIFEALKSDERETRQALSVKS